jgi:hypothetical protein
MQGNRWAPECASFLGVVVDTAPVGRFDDPPRRIQLAELEQKRCGVGELRRGSDAWRAIAEVDPECV